MEKIQQKLLKLADLEKAKSAQRFFKEEIKTYGLKSSDVNKIAGEYFSQIDKMDKDKVFEICEKLMKNGYQEDFGIATEFVWRARKKFEKTDFKIFEKWIAMYVDNWAKCDMFCNHTLNFLVEKFPDLTGGIKKWTKSKNRWVKRAAAVTFILSARKGLFIGDVFEICDNMLTDDDDMVQKGYGWALKAASQSQPKLVYDFVTARVDRMPRTAYRYAIEKLSADMKKSAMNCNK